MVTRWKVDFMSKEILLFLVVSFLLCAPALAQSPHGNASDPVWEKPNLDSKLLLRQGKYDDSGALCKEALAIHERQNQIAWQMIKDLERYTDMLAGRTRMMSPKRSRQR